MELGHETVPGYSYPITDSSRALVNYGKRIHEPRCKKTGFLHMGK